MHSAKWPLQNGGSESEGKRGGTKEVTHCPVTTFVPPVFALSWGGHFGDEIPVKKNSQKRQTCPTINEITACTLHPGHVFHMGT